VIGDPDDPQGDITSTLAFIRQLKGVNPAMELIQYYYTPIPQRRGTYGNVDAVSVTPTVLEEWCDPEWVGWMTHENPLVPWLDQGLKSQVEDFRTVLESRFPSVNDYRTAPWGRTLGRLLAHGRWERGHYAQPRMLRTIRRMAQRIPPDDQAYGHLRPPIWSSATT
jgi:hypothetical protein